MQVGRAKSKKELDGTFGIAKVEEANGIENAAFCATHVKICITAKPPVLLNK
jgi:hypothetical protein